MAKQSNPSPSAGTVNTSEDLLAELKAAQGGIEVSTNIQVEDRTEAPVEPSDLEYEETVEDLGTGFVLTTYGDVRSA